MDKKTRDLLDQQDWDRITLNLINYAKAKSLRIRWKTESYIDLPQGKTAEDIVYEAVEKIFSGERKWDPDRDPDLTIYLRSVVDSMISHLVKSANHRSLRRYPVNEEGIIREDMLSDQSPVKYLTPEEIALEEERSKIIVDKIFDEVEGEEELEDLVLLLREGYKPAEIAVEMGLDRDYVYQRLIRKLRRRCSNLSVDELMQDG